MEDIIKRKVTVSLIFSSNIFIVHEFNHENNGEYNNTERFYAHENESYEEFTEFNHHQRNRVNKNESKTFKEFRINDKRKNKHNNYGNKILFVI